MSRIALVALVSFLLSSCGASYPPERPPPRDQAQREAYRAEDVRVSGPGYPELEGKVFHYAYEGFAGFRLLIDRNRLWFQGVSGEFDGVTSLVDPQFSRVADGVYFMSWQVAGDMGDNVVVNVRDMKVFGHLGAGSNYRQIQGDIECFGNVDECVPPTGRIQPTLEGMLRVVLRRAFSESGEAAEAPAQARALRTLEGQQLVYRFEDEPVITLRVEARGAFVDEGRGLEPRGGVFTRPAEGLFFISWDGAHGGEHIVFQQQTLEVHDHITRDGRRVARVTRASSFGPAD